MKTKVIPAMTFRGMGDFVALALRDEGVFEVATKVTQGREILDRCGKLPAALVICDLRLPDMPVHELVRSLRAAQPEARVVIFSQSHNTDLTREVLAARPHGFAHLSEPLEEFLQVVRAVTRGMRSYSSFGSSVQNAPSDPDYRGQPDRTALSPQEKEVLKQVALGRSSKEIGKAMHLATRTIDHYRGSLMTKLNIHDAVGLTRYALSRGIVSLEEGAEKKVQTVNP